MHTVVLNAAPIRSPLIAQAREALVDTEIVVARVAPQRVGHAYAVAGGPGGEGAGAGQQGCQVIEALWQWLQRQLKRKRSKK